MDESNEDLGKDYWEGRYLAQDTGWDLGEISPPIKSYVDQLSDKNIRILIPGCGNSYEAQYLVQNGFTQVTVIDISPSLVEKLKEKFRNNPAITIISGDFFEHQGAYDLILEQTFFCALNPILRAKYVEKMYSLLQKNGKLVGLLFNREFEKQGPPFGGSKSSYEQLYLPLFEFMVFAPCYNSFFKRIDTELFFIFKKKALV